MSTRQQFMAAGVDIIAHMGNVQVILCNFTPDAVAVIPHLREHLRDMGEKINATKTVGVSPPCDPPKHDRTPIFS